MARSAVLLDAAGTLFDLKPDLEDRLVTALSPMTISTPEQAYSAIVRANTIGTWPKDQTDPEARYTGWVVFIEGLLADIPDYASMREHHAAAAARIAADIVDPTSYALTPGTLDLLQALKAQDLRCVIVSNFDHLLLDILAELQILPLVDAVTFSGELGCYKPDRRVFEVALASVRARPQDAIMVGDSVYLDVNGARAAGIEGVLFDPHDRHRDHGGPRIRAITDVLDLDLVTGAR